MLISSLYSRFLGYSLRIWNILAEMWKYLWFYLVRIRMISNDQINVMWGIWNTIINNIMMVTRWLTDGYSWLLVLSIVLCLLLLLHAPFLILEFFRISFRLGYLGKKNKNSDNLPKNILRLSPSPLFQCCD